MKRYTSRVAKMLKGSESADIKVGPESWFDFWHTHVDWNGIGNESAEMRQVALKALFQKQKAILKAMELFPKEFQCWVMVHPDSADDSVCLHSENPQNSFPYPFPGVEWSIELPALLQDLVVDTEVEVGVSQSEDRQIYWVLQNARSSN